MYEINVLIATWLPRLFYGSFWQYHGILGFYTVNELLLTPTFFVWGGNHTNRQLKIFFLRSGHTKQKKKTVQKSPHSWVGCIMDRLLNFFPTFLRRWVVYWLECRAWGCPLYQALCALSSTRSLVTIPLRNAIRGPQSKFKGHRERTSSREWWTRCNRDGIPSGSADQRRDISHNLQKTRQVCIKISTSIRREINIY